MLHRVSQGQAQEFLSRQVRCRRGSCDPSQEGSGLRPTPSPALAVRWSCASGATRTGSRPTGLPWPSPRRTCRCPRSLKSATASTGRTPSQSAATGSTSKMSGLTNQTPRVRCWRHCSQRCSGCRKFGPAGWLALAAPSSPPHVAGLAFGAARRRPAPGGSRLEDSPCRSERHRSRLPGSRSTRPRPDRRLSRATRPDPRRSAPRQRPGC